jgi:predicted RNase H-like nuclease (RuvC/YqgF family)
MSIFGKSNSQEVKDLKTEVSRLEKVIDKRDEKYEEDQRKLRDDHIKEIENIKKDNEIILARKDAEVDVKISKATAENTKQIAKLELENGNYKKEAEILTKAFNNLGFDVKDMKDILNKLVDGIVSKNIIQLVK